MDFELLLKYQNILEFDGYYLRFIPHEFLVKHPWLCRIAIGNNPTTLKLIPSDLINKDLCDLAIIRSEQYFTTISYIPEELCDQSLCNKAFTINSSSFQFIPEQYRTYDMCLKAIEIHPSYFLNVPEIHITEKIILDIEEFIINQKPEVIKLFIRHIPEKFHYLLYNCIYS